MSTVGDSKHNGYSILAVFPTHGTRSARPAVRDATDDELENFARYTAEEGSGLNTNNNQCVCHLQETGQQIGRVSKID